MKMRTCFAIAAAFVAANCTAGLFDAVKNVAGGVVGMGNSCQATMPSGANCKNAPVDGSSYCLQHKCRMCNDLAWADGLCRNCVTKAEAEAKAERRAAAESDRRRRMKADERARLGQGGSGRTSGRTAATTERRRVQTGRRRAANSENEFQGEERLFAGFELGRVAPFGKEKGERIKLKNAYLSIFEEAYLSYGANSHLLNRIGFGSIPIHADNESDLQPYVDKVLSGLKSYGYDMQLDGRHVKKPWRFKGEDCEITFVCNDVKRNSDGVADTYKQLVLTVENPKAKLLEKEYANKNSSGDGVVHEIVPFGGYGSERFLHCRSGAIYSVKTNNIAWCNGIEESIVKKNGGVLKLPRTVVHGYGLTSQGEYRLSPYSVRALMPSSEKETNVVDLTEFASSDLTNATEIAKTSSARLRLVLPDDAINARWFAEFIGKNMGEHTFCPFRCLGANEATGRQQAMRVLASAAKEFQFPADSFCPEHPLLYKELASGASKDWCRIWLALNASEFEEYDESAPRMDAADEFFSGAVAMDAFWGTSFTDPKRRLKPGEIKAKVGENDLRLLFSERHGILISVGCSFGGVRGVSKEALIAKYRSQFGDATNITVKNDVVTIVASNIIKVVATCTIGSKAISSISITGLALSAALEAEEKAKAAERRARDEAEAKKKELQALNF